MWLKVLKVKPLNLCCEGLAGNKSQGHALKRNINAHTHKKAYKNLQTIVITLHNPERLALQQDKTKR